MMQPYQIHHSILQDRLLRHSFTSATGLWNQPQNHLVSAHSLEAFNERTVQQ
ncbi:hypothetical protein DPMN_146795 [Dreissena polymorpha]|uniref:Uncharacterized protein n=1 Tax=Dreissena polymorpha TaxID=45954 RepID=A0A9D4F9A5_DREPO|nr:hypothetical protein DPMN_146795 [Dreissena polymorpha]